MPDNFMLGNFQVQGVPTSFGCEIRKKNISEKFKFVKICSHSAMQCNLKKFLEKNSKAQKI